MAILISSGEKCILRKNYIKATVFHFPWSSHFTRRKSDFHFRQTHPLTVKLWFFVREMGSSSTKMRRKILWAQKKKTTRSRFLGITGDITRINPKCLISSWNGLWTTEHPFCSILFMKSLAFDHTILITKSRPIFNSLHFMDSKKSFAYAIKGQSLQEYDAR